MILPAIEVCGISKRYVIQHESRHDNLRDTLHHTARRAWRKLRWGTGFESEDFWALRDVSFSVPPGEVVGIIGRNGAGKSTLLKILSRITEPTAGKVSIRGRVASLLEVGTGFHPDLTGRENVFLNGAILGMSRVEIREKFDEIVAFAEVEKFLDTPVKRYSSGMYVRLAFAVAAHLEPEILIVDEVLAVGDAAFQQKCLGKMKQVTKNAGRTVFFVSHNLSAVKQLCTSCIYLSQGQIVQQGDPLLVLDEYARAMSSGTGLSSGRFTTIVGSRLCHANGLSVAGYNGESGVYIEVIVRTDGNPAMSVECMLTDLAGAALGSLCPGHHRGWRLPAAAGTYCCRIPVALPLLATGTYGFDVRTVHHATGHDHEVPNAITFESSARLDFSKGWELRKEYQAGFLVLDDEAPSSKQVL
jgi:ABC-type polysaccharide/polyol phosphate transport system ATPase subunit